MSVQNILDRFNFLLSKGYSKDEVIFIIIKVPNIFSYSKEGLEEKIKVLKENGLENEIINRPTYLMQGVQLSYSRLKF